MAKATSALAEAGASAAVERQRAAEAALRVLGRFVGPLHRLCLELREQKRFLSRAYRRDAPLQVCVFFYQPLMLLLTIVAVGSTRYALSLPTLA